MKNQDMETTSIPFADFLESAFDKGDYSTDDVIAFVLPLFREVLRCHENGLVSPFEKDSALYVSEGRPHIDETLAHPASDALYRVQALYPKAHNKNFEVVEKVEINANETNTYTTSLLVHLDPRSPLQHPAYLPGYRCFELLLNHHDPQTDIFCLGLITGSIAMGLNLYHPGDLERFARTRSNPSHYNPRIHPTIGQLIAEMTELDRRTRSQDLYELILRMEHYRDYDPEKQADLSQAAGWIHKEVKERETFILNKLRNRLFDTSRRNRLLYYKPNMRFVNLTVSSVPMVLHYQSIRPELLFTWNKDLGEKITGMKEILLNKYLRFEDHAYLPSSLDRVRVESQRDIQEYGFSQLKLVIAFLNWHNLKEAPTERIQSPLLLLPVSLKKNRRLKEDHYILKVEDNLAEVNPVLAGQLKELYGIRLPDFIDLDDMSPEQFYQLVRAQIEEANQGVVLRYIDKPRIRLIHSEARQTVSNYQKRLRKLSRGDQNYLSIPYSYNQEDYRPLGLELYRQRIEPKTSFLEFLIDPDIKLTPLRFSADEPAGQPGGAGAGASDSAGRSDARGGRDVSGPVEHNTQGGASTGLPDGSGAREGRDVSGPAEPTGAGAGSSTGSPRDPQPAGAGAGNANGPAYGAPGERDTPRQRELYTLAESENNQYAWDFDVCHMVLGNFNYKKMSLVRDYNMVIDQQMQHHVFDALFSNEPRTFPEHPFDGNRPDDWYHVITADPTQTKAILQSRAGYSYIIQGPPGTGKSQTITNLIADFLARGKNILFVCEKRAALDVVYYRLKQVGLEELCCYIHDSQSDKREFIKNLKATYEDFTQNKLDLNQLKMQRDELLRQINDQLDILRGFHQTSTAEAKGTGMEVRQLIEELIRLREQLPVLTPAQEESLPSYKEWKASETVLNEIELMLDETGAAEVFSGHPFSHLQDNIVFADAPHQALSKAIREALTGLDEVESLLRGSPLDPSLLSEPERLKNLIQYAVLLYPLAAAGHLSLADPDGQEAKQLDIQLAAYRQQQERHQQTIQQNSHWRDKIPAQDIDAALAIAVKSEGSFFSFLNGSWRSLKKQLQQRYDLSQHAVKPGWVQVLQQLKSEYEAAEQVAAARRQLQDVWRLENIDTARHGIDLLHAKKGNPELAYLLHHRDGTSLVLMLQALHQPFLRLEGSITKCLQEMPSGSLSEIRDLLTNLQLNEESFGDWLPVLRTLARLPETVKKAMRTLPLHAREIEAAIARAALQEIYQSNRSFAATDRVMLDKAVSFLGSAYKELQTLNAGVIRAFSRQRFLGQLELAARPAAQLTEEQKKFKKVYNEGRKILENEFGKSMRYKSIRELSAKESGVVLKDIKPVWLMSPYSVSDSLPMDYDNFDVVIYDEASQITLEEGVPALYRSRQTIIVGDEKQMPPTDFFSTRTEDPDDLDKTLSREEDEWLSDDADSLLAQGARKLGSTLLCWHYRSHYETLISYSNHAFYEGDLLTIPDKTIHHHEKAPISITRPQEAETNAGTLFDRSISYHLLTNSVYDRRSNPGEASYIAYLVRELFRRGAKESIGIVAFSQEQQHAIETALNTLAGTDALFSAQLEEAYNRHENDQFVGLIIKNLENIQGDERDIIIMSVCYGRDSKGKMLMNFGPVNKKGGEKRLNVLFSRAKQHMAVVSSIRYDQITNEYNEGANYLRRFLQYAELISQGRMEHARAILDGLAPVKAETYAGVRPTIVRSQLKEQLTALGYEVAEQVGQSGFKCSLAVKRNADDEAWSLAILIDDDQHYRNKNLIEQYFQRPAILRSFGWKILAVYSKDWLHQPQRVMEQVIKALQEEPAQEPGGSTSGSALGGGGAAGGGGLTGGGAAGGGAGDGGLTGSLAGGGSGGGGSTSGSGGGGLTGSLAGGGSAKGSGSADGAAAGVPDPDSNGKSDFTDRKTGPLAGISLKGMPVTAMKAGGEARNAQDHLVFKRWAGKEGGVEKFWESAVDGNKLIIRWGKTGTRGQTQLKTLPDEASAQKERERQEKEQEAKGYRPV